MNNTSEMIPLNWCYSSTLIMLLLITNSSLVCLLFSGIFLFGCAAQQTITNIGKYSVGRLRPHFFDVCKPNWTEFSCKDSRDNYVFVEGDFCTGTDPHLLQEMRWSLAF